MGVGGPLYWDQKFITGPRFIGGASLGDCYTEIDEDRPPSGISIDMLAGGQVCQRSPALVRAPLSLAPSEFELTFRADREESYYAWGRAWAVGEFEPIEFWFARPLEDAWLIQDASTTWTLSRSLPFTLVDFATYKPRAWVRDRQGSSATEQTIVTTGTPATGEVKVIDTGAGITIETPDLSAEAGRLLVLRYHPIRLVQITGLSNTAGEPNVLDYTVSLREVVPARTY